MLKISQTARVQCVANCSLRAGLAKSGYVVPLCLVSTGRMNCAQTVQMCLFARSVRMTISLSYNSVRTDRICIGTIGLSDVRFIVKFVYDIPIF